MSKELAEAFSNIQPIPEVKMEYRMYYNVQGEPISMSSHNHPDGKYVVIDKDIYDKANYNCRVINGKLNFDLANQFHVQLKKSTTGQMVVKGHAALVVEEEYSEVEYYGRNN